MLAKSPVSYAPLPLSDDKVSGAPILEDHRVERAGPYRDVASEKRDHDLARELAMLHVREAQALRSALERSSTRRPIMGLLLGIASGAALTTTVAVAWLTDMEFRSALRVDATTWAREHRAIGRLEERLDTLERERTSPTASVATPTPSAIEPSPSPAPPGGLEVIPIATHEFVVSRSFLERHLETPSSARVIPHEVEGVILGVRVYGITSDSMAARLGLRNGDTLLSVNGISVATPDSALRAYTAVRESTSAELVILRRGRRIALRYTILG